jgi:hypothetical protein
MRLYCIKIWVLLEWNECILHARKILIWRNQVCNAIIGVFSKFHMLKLNPQYEDHQRWGIWKIIRSWRLGSDELDHCPKKKKKRAQERIFVSFIMRDTMRRSHLWPRRQAITRHQIYQCSWSFFFFLILREMIVLLFFFPFSFIIHMCIQGLECSWSWLNFPVSRSIRNTCHLFINYPTYGTLWYSIIPSQTA